MTMDGLGMLRLGMSRPARNSVRSRLLKKTINQPLERDGLHVCITKLRVAEGNLVVETEHGRKYVVDLKTRKSTELPKDKN
jgi:hypothetical protein